VTFAGTPPGKSTAMISPSRVKAIRVLSGDQAGSESFGLSVSDHPTDPSPVTTTRAVVVVTFCPLQRLGHDRITLTNAN
jgi:hypothetical protein